MELDRISDRCWNKFRQDSASALYSPYAICLAANDLNVQSFWASITQEIFFLNAFAKAYEKLIDCTEDADERTALKSLRDSVRDKIRQYDGHLNLSGLQVKKGKKIQEVTEFKSFLYAKATMEGKLAKSCTLAAIAVNRKLYLHVYSFVASSCATNNVHEYWIRYYTSDSFKDFVRKSEAVLDILSSSLRGNKEVEEEIESTYRHAMHLMVQFFHKIRVDKRLCFPLAQPHEPSEHHLHIFSDYDMTCTVHDSSSLLVKSKTVKSSDLVWDEIWGHVCTQRTAELEECLNVITHRKKIEEEIEGKKFDLRGLTAALVEIEGCEKNAYDRVIQSSLLKELSMQDIKATATGTTLKDDFKRFLERIAEKATATIGLHFISCCLCGELLRSIFSDLSPGLHAINIHSNELEFTEEFMTTGGIKMNVVSAVDKMHILLEENAKNADSVSLGEIEWTVEYASKVFSEENKEMSGNRTKHMNLYIGGDMIDLLCLHEANVGIVINPGQNITRLGDCFGVKFVPLSSALVQKQKELRELEKKKQNELCSVKKQKELCLVQKNEVWQSHSDTVYTVSCWKEIEAFVFGL